MKRGTIPSVDKFWFRITNLFYSLIILYLKLTDLNFQKCFEFILIEKQLNMIECQDDLIISPK